jgi:hypothetical protein
MAALCGARVGRARNTAGDFRPPDYVDLPSARCVGPGGIALAQQPGRELRSGEWRIAHEYRELFI